MENWFTVETVDSGIFALSESLHWEQVHSYLLLGTERALLIDTGLGVSDIAAAVRSLTELPVLAASTHAHWDHIGGHGSFGNVAVHSAEEEWVSGRFPLSRAAVLAQLLREPCPFPPEFNPEQYAVYQGGANLLLQDGDRIDLGGRQICVLHTPGHSPGHLCFYDGERQFLFSGDLIYAGCLDAFYPTTDPLLFAQSVRRIRALPVRRLLPGHGSLAISPELIEAVDSGFSSLEARGALHHGAGLFSFEGFQIRL